MNMIDRNYLPNLNQFLIILNKLIIIQLKISVISISLHQFISTEKFSETFQMKNRFESVRLLNSMMTSSQILNSPAYFTDSIKSQKLQQPKDKFDSASRTMQNYH